MSTEVIPKLRRIHLPQQSPRDALVTSVAAGIDRTLMRAVGHVVERQVLPRSVDLHKLRASIVDMANSGLADDPRAFFQFVRQLEKRSSSAPVTTLGRARRGPAGAQVYRRELTSTYTAHPELAVAGGNWRDRVQFQHWVHEAGSARGTVIILHGFAMGWPAVDAKLLSARQWFRQGLDVALLTLPDHGPRRSPGAMLSGQRFTVPHALALAAAVQQAVHEIFELKRWLRQQSAAPVGIFGMSLGGYLASLCAGLSEDFDFVIPLVPPACMGDLAWRVYRETTHHRSGYEPALTEQMMRAAFFVHSPLAHPRRVEKSRILILAGAGDRIVPPEHPSALWEHWERPAIHWFRGSHVAPVAGSGLMKIVSRHLEELNPL